MDRKLIYFGCRTRAGHYFHSAQNGCIQDRHAASNFKYVPWRVFEKFDGLFVPSYNLNQGSGTYIKINDTEIIQWHDYSIDNRPGSNSAFIFTGFVHIKEMSEIALINFPDVFKRQSLFNGMPFKIINEQTNS